MRIIVEVERSESLTLRQSKTPHKMRGFALASVNEGFERTGSRRLQSYDDYLQCRPNATVLRLPPRRESEVTEKLKQVVIKIEKSILQNFL